MKGFFSNEELDAPAYSRRLTCRGCSLHKQCQSPKMAPTGKGKVPVLFIAEAPGKTEDLRGEQLIGKAGKVLREALSSMGIHLDDCRKMNAVNCRPPKNRAPTPKEIDACRPMLNQEITEHSPKVIVLLGSSALRCLFGNRQKDLSITKYRGWAIPDPVYDCWVVPTLHPSYVMRDGGEPVERCFRSDLWKAVEHIEKKPDPLRISEVDVECITSSKQAVTAIEAMHEEADLVAFDYETTGLKPYKQSHQIYSASIASRDRCISFLVDGDGDVMDALADLLEDPTVGKIGANMEFESSWTEVVLGAEVRGWEWDCLLGAHLEDNRTGITSVKFQAFVQLGVEDWSKEIKSYLRAPNAHAMNRIRKVPVEKVLFYGGKDAIVEYELAMLQRKRLGL